MKNNVIFLLFFLIISCSKKEEESDLAEDNFFNVVYETLAVREVGDSLWILTDGTRDVKFNQTTQVSKEEELQSDIEGTFQFLLTDFTMSTSIPKCSGGWNGTFVLNIALSGGNEEDQCNNGDPYNILNPYCPDGVGTSNPEDTVEELRTYEFKNTVKDVNLYPQESCSIPFITHTLKVVRFPNGTLIMEDIEKRLEYFLRPKLRTER